MTDEIRRAIYRALCACLELAPDSREASGLIRPVMPQGENPPRMPRSENAIYYDLLPDTAPDAGYAAAAGENPEAGTAVPAVTSFMPYRLLLVCYGPGSEWNARRIRSFLYLDGSGYPRRILREAGIFPVPRPPMPVLLHEEAGGMIRRRADLLIRLGIRETIARSGRQYEILRAPAVILRDGRNGRP